VGFSPESSTHDIQALRFTGCPVNLRIPSPPGRRMGERSMVIGGWEIHTLSDPGLSVLMPLGESGRLMLPCSESWFAVAIPDADAGRLHCAGADEHGVIRMASVQWSVGWSRRPEQAKQIQARRAAHTQIAPPRRPPMKGDTLHSVSAGQASSPASRSTAADCAVRSRRPLCRRRPTGCTGLR
jgi:hypothetical protein